MSKKKYALYGFAGLTVGALIWEHLAKVRDRKMLKDQQDQQDQQEGQEGQVLQIHEKTPRPSQGLEWASAQAQTFWTFCGKLGAKLSSFYTFVDLKDFKETAIDIGKPAFNIVVSPVYTIKGYVQEMDEYQYKYLIVFGTVTIGGVAYGACRYFDVPVGTPIKEFLTKNKQKILDMLNKE